MFAFELVVASSHPDGSLPLRPEPDGSPERLDALSGHAFEEERPKRRLPRGTLAPFAVPAAAAIKAPPAPTRAACSTSLLPPSERLLLTTEAIFFHGSTALDQVLMSAPQVATLCPGRAWECEAFFNADRCNECRTSYTPGKEPGAKNAVACLACAEPVTRDQCANYSVAQVFRANLQLFEEYWEAQPNRSVLVVKWAPLYQGLCGFASHWFDDTWPGGRSPNPNFTPLFPNRIGALGKLGADVLTPRMRRAGVSTLRWAVLLMHRPWCMWHTSSHARDDREADISAWAEEELANVEMLVALHKELSDQGVPVLVITYAQMLWDPEQVTRRIGRFAPCLGSDVDLDYIPRLGEDIVSARHLPVLPACLAP